jgi:hypothetical protein
MNRCILWVNYFVDDLGRLVTIKSIFLKPVTSDA